jgi:predicted transcriptional regulator
MLGWRQSDLARAAGLSEIGIKKIEAGKTTPRRDTLTRIVQALEAAGVEFSDNSGVRLT